MSESEHPRTQSPRTLGIVAGGGTLPLLLADAARAEGRKVFIIGIIGAAGPEIEVWPHDWIRIAAVGRLLRLLKKEKCQDVVLIGTLTRPRVRDLVPDFEGLLVLPGFIRRLRRAGDDALLRGVIDYLEKHGLRVVGAHTILTNLLAPEGLFTETIPTAAQQQDIALGVVAARELGRQDIGQGVVVCRGEILERENATGTDAMLARVASLPPYRRGSSAAREGVLVKLPKPAQDRRVDLPTIGVRTVEGAAAAGLLGIAVEAGGTLISDRDATIRKANELGLFILGLPAGVGAKP